MNIMIVGSEIACETEVSSFTGMWLYNLPRALQSQGETIRYFPRCGKTEDEKKWAAELLYAARDCDVILAIGVRYFTTLSKEVCQFLRKKFKGVISQTYDCSLLDTPYVDLTLTLIDCTRRYQSDSGRLRRHLQHNEYIGWAADPHLFYPNKGDKIRIFLDHPHYIPGAPDYSHVVINSLRTLTIPFEARTLGNSGLKDVDIRNATTEIYNRFTVPSQCFANELNKSHVFVCTHPESLGQTILEAAMAGCIILVPSGKIPGESIQQVHHITYDTTIDWQGVINQVNPVKNRQKVLHLTWETAARNTIAALQKHLAIKSKANY